MQNRFGLKDFVVTVLIVAVGVSVWFSMVQEDRRWQEVSAIDSRVQGLEQQLARLDRRLEQGVEQRLDGIDRRLETGVVTAPAPGGASAPGRAGLPAWAVPGVPIEWHQYEFATDPRTAEDFADGGTYTEVFSAQPSTITPLVYKDVYGPWVFERVCEYLAVWDPKTLELRGVLADAWQYPADGTWLRVHINPRARFSDGAPVTADDVVFTFNLMRNPEVQAERPRSITDFINRCERIDERTVEFGFGSVLFTNLSATLYTFPILPKHFYERFTPTQLNQSTGLVMGSGPYKLELLDPEDQWSPGEYVLLVRNEQYWGPRPAVERVRFNANREDLPRLIAFENGESDVTTASPDQYDRLVNDSAFLERADARLWFNMRGGYNFIGWNCGPRNGRPTPFADKRVRRAMTMILDRQLIADDFFRRTGRVATGPFSRETDQADPSIEPLPYDLDAARALLAEAGWVSRDASGVLTDSGGREFEFEFTYPSGSEVTEKIARYLKDQSAKVGIRCSLRTMDWSVFMQTLDTRDYDAMTLGWSPGSPESDPQQIWHSRYIENQGDNFVQWNSAEADAAIEAGRTELDHDRRIAHWHRLHQIIHDEQPYTFMVERPWIRLVQKRVGNFVEYKSGFEREELFIRSGGAASPTPGGY